MQCAVGGGLGFGAALAPPPTIMKMLKGVNKLFEVVSLPSFAAYTGISTHVRHNLNQIENFKICKIAIVSGRGKDDLKI